MLHIGHESIELCGGTHVGRTGDIGSFKILSDEAVGKGTRRIVAATGLNAWGYTRDLESRVRKTSELLKSAPAELPARVSKLLEEQRELQKQLAELKRRVAEGGGGGPAQDPSVEARSVGDAKVLSVRSPLGDAGALREFAEKLRDKLGRAVVVVGGVSDEKKVVLVCAVSKDLTAKYSAGKILKDVAAVVGGGGGGRPDFAQAGGNDPSRLDEALAKVYTLIAP
jgi:alanyl-tRNA synthetase